MILPVRLLETDVVADAYDELDEAEFDLRTDGALTSLSDLQQIMYRQRLDTLYLIEQSMETIYERAQIARNRFFEESKKYFGTEYETHFLPQVRKRPGRAVELYWIRKYFRKKAASNDDIKKYGDNTLPMKHGKLYRIIRDKSDTFLLRIEFKTVPRGPSISYNKKIFAYEPSWAKSRCQELEMFFTNLRKEAAILKQLKISTRTLHGLNQATGKYLAGEGQWKELPDPTKQFGLSDLDTDETEDN